MSITISDYIKNCQLVARQILDEQERIVLANEIKIIRLNVESMQEGIGSDDRVLDNSNPRFKGVYSLSTQLLDPQKVAGTPYNFMQTGEFLSNLQIDLQPSLTKFDIFSTGTGSGEKALFFSGYTNLFGLNKDKSYIVNYEIVYPELMTFIKKYL